MVMYGRFDRNTRHLKHWSTVPFTVLATEDELDATFPPGTVRPSGSVRATVDWSALAPDPEPEPLPPPHFPNRVLGYMVDPPVWFCGAPAVDSFDARLEEIFHYQVNSAVAISAQRGSVLVFDFTEWPGVTLVPTTEVVPHIERLHGQWLDVMNCHAACLAHALSETAAENLPKREIRPDDLIFVHAGGARGGPGLVAVWGMKSLPPPVSVISASVLHRATGLTAEVLEDPAVALPAVALLNRAATYCEAQNFALSLVAAWTVSEHLLNAFRRRHGIPAGTAAAIAAALTTQGHLTDSLNDRLTSSRQARNRWLHEGNVVEWDAANAAIDTACLIDSCINNATTRSKKGKIGLPNACA
jgi:hypothetical protein